MDNKNDITKHIKLLASNMRNAIELLPKSLLGTGMEHFPRGACGDASLLLGAYLADSGYKNFEYVCGERGSKNDDTWTSHAWLTSGNLIVDITADQFGDAPSGIIVSNNSPWHNQFRVESSYGNEISDFRLWTGGGIPQLHRIYEVIQPSLQMLDISNYS